ncbi:hypothetical protein TNCV_1539401 [Trichonephila clavipes]|nr:hypothetical protein TNCV_1539401 [Trichonephila clavipes]
MPPLPKPRKGKGQPQKENKSRNEATQANAAKITPASFAQAVQDKNPNRGQHEEMTPRRPIMIQLTKFKALI